MRLEKDFFVKTEGLYKPDNKNGTHTGSIRRG
jgi:hypothetical protein